MYLAHSLAYFAYRATGLVMESPSVIVYGLPVNGQAGPHVLTLLPSGQGFSICIGSRLYIFFFKKFA